VLAAPLDLRFLIIVETQEQNQWSHLRLIHLILTELLSHEDIVAKIMTQIQMDHLEGVQLVSQGENQEGNQGGNQEENQDQDTTTIMTNLHHQGVGMMATDPKADMALMITIVDIDPTMLDEDEMMIIDDLNGILMTEEEEVMDTALITVPQDEMFTMIHETDAETDMTTHVAIRMRTIEEWMIEEIAIAHREAGHLPQRRREC